ncbi:MAG: DUF3857 domain-containing protein [Cryomorphaceae bacterium]|nr:DUF3857 domain-containing protein [Cryomorphaceae bacterium]
MTLHVVTGACVFGQNAIETLSFYSVEFPGEQGVELVNEEIATVIIDKKGNMRIEVDVTEESLFFTSGASRFASERIYYSGFESIDNLKAYSLVPKGKSGKKYKKLKIDEPKVVANYSSNIFFDDVKRMEFDFPGLVEGSKTHLSYTRVINEPRFFGRFFFASSWPAEKTRMQVRFPENVRLNHRIFGLDTEGIVFTKTKEKKDSVYTWEYSRPPVFRDAVNTLPRMYRVPHVVVFVDSYTFEGEERLLNRDVASLYDWYYALVENVNLEPDAELKALADSLTKDAKSEWEMVENIYYWVQSNIKYIAIEDGMEGFVPRPANAVFQRRYGDCKDMSSIIHTLLTLKGIPAYLTWVGTDVIPYSYHDVPTPKVDNHMICTYYDGEQYYILDGTASFLPLGLMPSNIQGKEVLIGKGKNDFVVYEIPQTPAEVNYFRDSISVVFEGEKLRGVGKLTAGGYYAEIYKHRYAGSSKDKEKKNVTRRLTLKGNNKFVLDDFSVNTELIPTSELDVDYNFTLDMYHQTVGNEVYINPHFKRYLQNEFIKDGVRLANFSKFTRHYTNINRIEIPDNLRIQSMPEDIELENEDVLLRCTYEKRDGYILVTEEVKVKNRKIPEDRFEAYNDLITKANRLYRETITLEKTN